MTSPLPQPLLASPTPNPPTPKRAIADREREALDRLILIAARDTNQSRRVASFLLAWWNAAECGGFDFVDLWSVDHCVLQDMITVLSLVVNQRCYPSSIGYGLAFEQLAEMWHPRLSYVRVGGGL